MKQRVQAKVNARGQYVPVILTNIVNMNHGLILDNRVCRLCDVVFRFELNG